MNTYTKKRKDRKTRQVGDVPERTVDSKYKGNS
jgi:hypothetical protein